jgi:hypothetical protein
MQRLDNAADGTRALRHAEYFTRFWRIGGGPGFDSSVNYVSAHLAKIGFGQQGSSPGTMQILEDPPTAPVWVPENASLSITSPEVRTLLTFSDVPLMLCRNSFPQDRTAELVYVPGGGKETDYESVYVEGKIVLCDVHPSAAFRYALPRGAIGIISSFVPQYNHPDRYPQIIAEGFIPYDRDAQSFGLNISPSLARELRQLLTHTRVEVRVEIASRFITSPVRTLVAEIPGHTHPEQRIVLVAHIDHYKPGANDNASGSATLLEIAESMTHAIRRGDLPYPARTLTFLWVDEYKGTQHWLRRQSDPHNSILAALVLDMVGGNPAITGGSFRVERMPDPGVIWTRPPDRHSGWGAGTWEKEKLVGNFLNDFYLSVVGQRARTTHWLTTQNVWEGGSDHDIFLRAGIPALLSWHWPDFAYHSSMDVIGNLSTSEMQHTAVSVGTAALALMYGSEPVAYEVLRIVSEAAQERMRVVEANAITEITDVQPRGAQELAATKRQELDIITAWERWYDEALRSVARIPVNRPSDALRAEIHAHTRQLAERSATIKKALGLE